MIVDKQVFRKNMKTDLSNHVVIWHTNMDSQNPNSYIPFLTNQEISRANRILNEKKKHRMIISRGILRSILGSYLDIEPAKVNIEIQPTGKPYLSGQSLYFNVTHSRELLLVVISKNTEIGIDVEWIEESIDPRQIASFAFSYDEIVYLEERNFSLLDFYKLWTMKEAILKAAGLGFSYPSNKFSVILSKDHSILSSILGDVTKGSPCSIHPINFFPGFSAALAEIHHFSNLARN